MQVIRTPDERFANLPGFEFESHYLENIPHKDHDERDGSPATLRIHYLDEGPRDGQIVLLMHGEPSWSYLYRTMIPVLTAGGIPVHSPGPGRLRQVRQTDRQGDYTFARHVDWMRSALFDGLDLPTSPSLPRTGAVSSAFAWSVRTRNGSRASSLPTVDYRRAISPCRESFIAWQKFASETDSFPSGGVDQWRVGNGLVRRCDCCLRCALPRRSLLGGREGVSVAGTNQSRRSRDASKPRRVANAGGVPTPRSSPRSVTRTRSPRVVQRRSSAECRGRKVKTTRRFRVAGTFSKRIAARNWPRWSSNSLQPTDFCPPGCQP